MTSEDRPPEPVLHEGPRTPAEYVENGRMWLELAEWEILENESPDRAGTPGMLAIASALLGLCAQFIREKEDD